MTTNPATKPMVPLTFKESAWRWARHLRAEEFAIAVLNLRERVWKSGLRELAPQQFEAEVVQEPNALMPNAEQIKTYLETYPAYSKTALLPAPSAMLAVQVAAVRMFWKLVRKFPDDWELYDMETDRTEMHDLADQHPERVRAMTEQYLAWAKRCGVIPREKILDLMKAAGETAFWEEEKQK